MSRSVRIYDASDVVISLGDYIISVNKEEWECGDFRFQMLHNGIEYEGSSDLDILDIPTLEGFRRYVRGAIDCISIDKEDDHYLLEMSHPFAYHRNEHVELYPQTAEGVDEESDAEEDESDESDDAKYKEDYECKEDHV